ncbi:MAG: hypothetical protein ACM3TT_11860 [Syntrophothermus sp.]
MEERLPEFLKTSDEDKDEGPAGVGAEIEAEDGVIGEVESESCDGFEPRAGTFAAIMGEGDPVCENCMNWGGEYCNLAGPRGACNGWRAE